MIDLSSLSTFPAILEHIVSITPESLWRQRSRAGAFALVEHAWHVADLEEEAYAMRIERLLSEEAPSFADFAGNVVAIERRYLDQDLRPALARYVAAREAN